MKKILLSLAVVGAFAAAAAPAAAQPWPQSWNGDGQYRTEHERDRSGRLTASYVDSLDWKITNAAREGRISWDQARDLRRQVHQVRPLAWRVQTGDADRWEVVRLERVVSHIERTMDARGWRGRDSDPRYGDQRYDGQRYGDDAWRR